MSEMVIQVHECSVVVLASLHNPTILHPEFLKSQEIVPDDWQPKTKETVCSLPFSRTAYTNGIVIVAEPNKLRVIDTEPPSKVASSMAPGVAERYVRTLPHVKHTAVGINFEAFLERPNPTAMVVDRFIKDGPWLDEPLKLAGCGLRLQYALDIARVNISIDPAERHDAGGEGKDGLLLKSNYHNDITGGTAEASSAEVQSIISRYGEFCEHFGELSGILMWGGK